MEKIDFEKDIKIDESALDIEWLNQSSLTLKFCRLEADLKREVDKKEIELGLIRADLDRRIRLDPEGFEITTKITETVINNIIISSEEYMECNEVVLDARYEYSVARGAVKAIDSKKTSLENLVKLFGQQYFAGPNVPRDISKEWEQKQLQENSNEKVRIRRRKK